MWRVFYANYGPILRGISLEKRLKWLDIHVMSIAACLWVTWPFSVCLSGRIDKTQVHMIEQLIDYNMKQGTSIETFYRTRAMVAGRTAKSHGRWSVRWANSVLRWHDHCTRENDTCMWHSRILQHNNPAWLEAKRIEHGRGIISRTKTRLLAGKVSVRWCECLEVALAVAPQWRTVLEHNLNVRTIISASLV